MDPKTNKMNRAKLYPAPVQPGLDPPTRVGPPNPDFLPLLTRSHSEGGLPGLGVGHSQEVGNFAQFCLRAVVPTPKPGDYTGDYFCQPQIRRFG